MQSAKEKFQAIRAQLRLPIMVAPMFLVSGYELVAAACQSGVLASFPTPNARTIEELESWMQQLAAQQKAAPWVLSTITHSTYARLGEEITLIRRYQPAIVITALGSPKPVLEAVHSYGGLVFADVNSIAFAKKAAEAGADGLILVCAGAGGHTGMLSPFAFIEEVRSFWDGPIILAGSISTARAIRAAEVLGADLAYMGTRFIATDESRAVPAYKTMLTHTHAQDIIATAALTGVTGHFIRESLLQAGITPDMW